MIANLLLAAELIDVVANPSRTIEEHETGAARLAVLAAHGVPLDSLSLQGANLAHIDLLSGHIWRWALNEAKQVAGGDVESRLPQQAILQAIFFSETDRTSRLLLVESILTHPETERKLGIFYEQREPIPLVRLPDTWPRNYLIELSHREDEDGETPDSQADANLTEFGMLLLQIATPPALAFLGGTVLDLRERGREDHPLPGILQSFLAGRDDEVVQRVGLRIRPGRFA